MMAVFIASLTYELRYSGWELERVPKNGDVLWLYHEGELEEILQSLDGRGMYTYHWRRM